MVIGLFTLLCAVALSDSAGQITGTIEGVVVNTSRNNVPLARSEVILQVQLDGQFAPVEKTWTDDLGRFHFDNLPVGADVVYLPGATRHEVFYPGRRIQLTSSQRTAYLTVSVHDAVTQPNPLIIRQHEVVLRSEPGVLQVVEAMLIDNPGNTTYVGGGAAGQGMVATLRLGIPSDFIRLTFEKEFFGRQFDVVDGQVITTIPWTPGTRWLRYTYTLPSEDARGVWERQFDVPCEHLLIRVRHERPHEVTSNLGAAVDVKPGEAVFEFAGESLPAGRVVQITLGRLPRLWTYYARWTALAVLAGLVIGTAAWRWLKRPRRAVADAVTEVFEPPIQKLATLRVGARNRTRKQRRRAA